MWMPRPRTKKASDALPPVMVLGMATPKPPHDSPAARQSSVHLWVPSKSSHAFDLEPHVASLCPDSS